MASSGESTGGSISYTSIAAPAMTPPSSARIKAGSSTTPPRACVHQDRVRLHRSQRCIIDQVMGGRDQRAVQRHDVAARQQFLERNAARVGGFQHGIADEQLDVEPLQSPGDLLADAAEADQPDGRSGELERCVWAGALPFAGTNAHIICRDAPQHRQDHRHRVVGDALVVGAGRRHDGNTHFRGSRNIDGVDADTHAGDHAADRDCLGEPLV